jgi:SHAQKYF class myb-like DNA-binding protein
MSTSASSSNKLQPLAAPPLISAPVRIMIPSSSPPLSEPSLVVTPNDPEMMEESSGDLNICGDKEKVGRWTEQEHQVFLEGLQTFGKQWKTIAGMIGTRTVVQVRTHAQKYFQKMERSNGAIDFVVPPKVKPAGRSQAKRKSLPSSLPSRKKTRKSPPRLSMGTRASSNSLLAPAARPTEPFYQASSTEM